MAKYAGSEIPELHLWIRYSMDHSFKTADFSMEKRVREL
jgi:hypothetical protein